MTQPRLIISLKDRYQKQVETIEDKEDYIILQSEGITNLNPRWSPSSEKIAYLSDKGNDYYGRTSLYVYSLKMTKEEFLQTIALVLITASFCLGFVDS